MQEPLKTQGYWWLPPNKDKTLPGTLIYEPGKDIRLELFGSFHASVEDSEVRLIHGVTADNKIVTLRACHASSHHWSSAGVTLSAYSALQMLLGWHFDSEDEIQFTEFSARPTHFHTWLGLSGLNMDLAKLQETPKSVTISHVVQDDQPLGQFGGTQFLAEFHAVIPGTKFNERKLAVHETIRLKLRSLEPRPVRTHFEDIRKLYYLLTLMVGGPVRSIDVVGRNPAFSEDHGGKPHAKDIQIVIVSQKPEDEDILPMQMLLTYGAVQDQLPSIIERLFASYEVIEHPFELLMGTRYASWKSAERYFLDVVRAFEAFHRRTEAKTDLPADDHAKRLAGILDAAPVVHRDWLRARLEFSNERSLRTRLKDLWDSFPAIVQHMPHSRADFSNKVSATRNYLTHFSQDIKDRAVLGVDLYQIARHLHYLAEASVLKWLGVSTAVIDAKYVEKVSHEFRQTLSLDP